MTNLPMSTHSLLPARFLRGEKGRDEGLSILHPLKYILFFIVILLSSLSYATQLIIEPKDGRAPILNTITHAQSSIDLAIYGFTDPEIMNAIIQTKSSGKNVHILLQHFPYKSATENLPAIQRFSTSHVATAYPASTFYLLHQKTLITDHRLAIVMTFNFTRSTFDNMRNFGLIITDPSMVQEIQKVFDADWQHRPIQPHHPNLVWSPDNSRIKILGFINSAKSDIKIYAQGLSDYQVVGALAGAARRGVNVQILTSDALSVGKTAYLQKAGVKINLDTPLRIHAKVIIVDQQKALLGSINFTQTSIDKNRELAVITDDPKIVHELLEVYREDGGMGKK